MRRITALTLTALGVIGLAAFTPAGRDALEHFAGQGPPINMAARQETYRGDPMVVVSYSDTNSQTVVRTDVRRRSTGADTFWVVRGYTTGKGDSLPGLRARMTFRDPGVTMGKTYRYEARDSISGAALTAWGDSVSITVTSFVRSQ